MNDSTLTPHTLSSSVFAEMLDLRQWVAWQYVARQTGKPAKRPICPATGRAATVHDPSTWGTYAEALRRQIDDDLPGLGFVLTADDPWTVTDLDNCIDGAGQVSLFAKGIVEFLASYTELSPSGTGLHIWTLATLPPGRRNAKSIEMYDSGQYLTVTFNPLPCAPLAIAARAEEIRQLHTIYLGQVAKPAERQPTANTAPTIGDEDLVKRILRSRIGPRFELLWSGDASGYPSPSEADLALAGYLAFWTQEEAQLDRIFRLSGLYRPERWDAGRGDFPTYGQRTVRRAIANRAGTYDPNWRSTS